MYQGWFCLGGTEIINNMRTVGYAGTASQLTNYWGIPKLSLIPGVPDERPSYCNINWFVNDDECPFLFDALNDTFLPDSGAITWEAINIQEDAPWASPSEYEASSKFMGAYALEVSELSDSTRSVSIVEGITNGGVLGRSRLTVPRFRFRVLLTALDEEGLEYGTAWLNRVLDEQACGSHGPSCGSTDLTFFASCPPSPDAFVGSEGSSDPNAVYEMLLRTYHDVKCIEGPVVTQEIVGKSENTYGRIVEFTLAAGVPNLFGKVGMQVGELDSDFATIVNDVPRNSIAVPSAEAPGVGAFVVATNYAANPSVETNATGWAATSSSLGATGAIVGTRQVGLAAVGTAAYRVRMTASAVSAVAQHIAASQTVTLPVGAPVGTRYSINMWASSLVSAGTAAIDRVEITAQWRDGTTPLGDPVAIGTMPATGGARSLSSLLPPAGATNVVVTAYAYLTSWSATAVVDLYADALAVTVP